MNILFLCTGNAAGETRPAYLGKVIRAHWGVEDPAKALGTDAEIAEAFELAYAMLRKRIEAFMKLPASLFEAKNEVQLQTQLNAIGEIN